MSFWYVTPKQVCGGPCPQLQNRGVRPSFSVRHSESLPVGCQNFLRRSAPQSVCVCIHIVGTHCATDSPHIVQQTHHRLTPHLARGPRPFRITAPASTDSRATSPRRTTRRLSAGSRAAGRAVAGAPKHSVSGRVRESETGVSGAKNVSPKHI